VYNLEVYQVHNYSVSEVGVLVHNSYGPAGLHSAINNKWGKTMSANDMREIQNTVDRIKTNDTSVYPFDDGRPFKNSHFISPDGQRLNTGNTYTEWTIRTPGVGNRGTRRIVVNNQTGQAYYTNDHYENFVEIDLSAWH
jgi:guanyl-specific ribonuclease Sa